MKKSLAGYTVAVLAVAVALFLKFKVSLLVELEGGFLMLLAAVVVAGWYGGPGPGLLATLLSLLFSSRYSPLPLPAQSVALLHPLPFMLFLLDGVLVSLVAARLPGRRKRVETALAGQCDPENPALVLDALLARMSHDLRSPLNAILGWAQLGQLPAGGDASTRERAWLAVEQNARSQLRLIDQMLDAVAVLHGRLDLKWHRVDFASEIDAAAEALAPEAQQRGILVSLDLPEGLAPVAGDGGRLRTVAGELLANAIEATPRNGVVQARLAQEGMLAVLTVSDTGPGIPPAQQPYLFTLARPPGWQGNGRHGRWGLGLVIVRRLVELHGGCVSASAGDGGGACFIVRIPLSSPE